MERGMRTTWSSKIPVVLAKTALFNNREHSRPINNLYLLEWKCKELSLSNCHAINEIISVKKYTLESQMC